jgi:citrate lyase beta subunit
MSRATPSEKGRSRICRGNAIFDLEDSVPPPFKVDARRHVADALARLDFRRAERIVRINAAGTDEAQRDLAALPIDLIDTIMVPKVERPEALAALDGALAAAERRCRQIAARRADRVEEREKWPIPS